MAKNIYGFIIDEALHKWSANALIGRSIDQGVGFASENVLEYFNEVSVIKDPRSSRMTNYLTNNDTFYGSLGFLVDSLPPNSDGVSGATSTDATAADTFEYGNLASGELDKIFNIIEDCLYNRNTSSSQMVTSMLNVLFSSNGKYTGYVVGSLQMSTSTVDTESFVNNVVARTTAGTILSASDLQLPYWIKFGFNSETIGMINFTLYLHRDTFLSEYPYSTIVDVVFPYESSILAQPSHLPNTSLDTLVNSGSFVNTVYSTNLARYEATGAKLFTTPYIPDTYNINMPFGIIYKGTAPGTDLCKKAVRNALLATEIPETTWQIIFPELFVASKFYLIPIWDNKFTPAPGTQVEMGITKWNTIYNKLLQIFPNYSTALLNERLEFILNDATNLIIAVLPDASNDSNKWLSGIHSTYVPVDATDSIWAYQEAATKTFNRRLSYAIGDSRRGGITHTEITEEMINCGTEDAPINRKFLYFSWNHVDYFLLDMASWAELA